MVEFKDQYLKDKVIGKPLTIVAIWGCASGLKICGEVLITKKEYDLFFLCMVAACIVLLAYLINSVAHLVSNNKIIHKVNIEPNSISLFNMHGKKISYLYDEILSVKEGQNFKMLTPQYFKKDKQGLTITFSDGKFFRISPHMSNLPLLQNQLETFALENNPNKKFIKPRRIKLYSRPIANILIVYLGLASFFYSCYVTYNIFQINYTEISTLFRGLFQWPFSFFDSSKLNQTNSLIYQNFIPIKKYVSHFPLLSWSFLVWVFILSWGPTHIINTTIKYFSSSGEG